MIWTVGSGVIHTFVHTSIFTPNNLFTLCGPNASPMQATPPHEQVRYKERINSARVRNLKVWVAPAASVEPVLSRR